MIDQLYKVLGPTGQSIPQPHRAMSDSNHYETLLYGNGQFVKKSHITLLFEWLSGRTTLRGCDDCGQIPCIGHVAVRDDDSDAMRWTPDGEEP